jgi:hypothetical protein
MMQSMKGATMLLGSMNRQMNLPALQRIAMEFERENEIMDERQEMMDDAIDEATGMEGEEEEGEDILKEIFDEIGVDLNQAVCARFSLGLSSTNDRSQIAGCDPDGHTSHRCWRNTSRPGRRRRRWWRWCCCK